MNIAAILTNTLSTFEGEEMVSTKPFLHKALDLEKKKSLY